MSDKNMKSLAKKRAEMDDDSDATVMLSENLQPKVKNLYVNKLVKDYEKERDEKDAMERMKTAKPYESDLDDHASKNPRVKRQMKFRMLRRLIKDMDDMDGDGMPD